VRVIGDKSGDGATITAQKSLFGCFPDDLRHGPLGHGGWEVGHSERSGNEEAYRNCFGRGRGGYTGFRSDGDDAGAAIQSELQTGGWSGAQRRHASSRRATAKRPSDGGQAPRMGGGTGPRGGNGDISQMLERAPKIALST